MSRPRSGLPHLQRCREGVGNAWGGSEEARYRKQKERDGAIKRHAGTQKWKGKGDARTGRSPGNGVPDEAPRIGTDRTGLEGWTLMNGDGTGREVNYIDCTDGVESFAKVL